jgi:hypothetical protein
MTWMNPTSFFKLVNFVWVPGEIDSLVYTHAYAHDEPYLFFSNWWISSEYLVNPFHLLGNSPHSLSPGIHQNNGWLSDFTRYLRVFHLKWDPQCASAGGIYSEVADATADIFRAQGIGPLSKWVDDHIFFWIQRKYLSSYNAKRSHWHNTITKDGGCLQSGSCLWYLRENLPDDLPAEFNKDAAAALKDLSLSSACSDINSLFSYCNADVNTLSEHLGILWEPSKTIPFFDSVPFLGFWWNISSKTVEITEEKKTKYKAAIE